MGKLIIKKHKENVEVVIKNISVDEISELFGEIIAKICFNDYRNDVEMPAVFCTQIYFATEYYINKLRNEKFWVRR